MNWFRPIVSLVIVATVLATTEQAHADFVTVSGRGNILNPASTPTGASADFFQDTGANKLIHGWAEQQNVTLVRDVYVDIAGNGTYNSNSDLGGFHQLKIAQGTVVSSHYLYFDPVYRNRVTNVTFTFDGPIIGVIVNSDRFHNAAHGKTDYYLDSDFLGNPLTHYPHHHFDDRGLEWRAGDTVVVSGNSITLSLWASSPGDQIRVITAPGGGGVLEPVPAPPGLLLALSGFVAVGMGRVWRRIYCRTSVMDGTGP